MKQYIEVTNNPVEYYQNGNVKSYSSTLYHTELDKYISVKHKDYDEYSRRFSNAQFELEQEYEAVIKNKEVEYFYKFLTGIANESTTYPFDISHLYHEAKYPEIKYFEPRLSEFLKDFSDNERPDYEKDYKTNFSIIWLILFPIYIVKSLMAKKKYTTAMTRFQNRLSQFKEHQDKKEKYKIEKENYDRTCKKIDKEVERNNSEIDKVRTEYGNDDESLTRYLELSLMHKMQVYYKVPLEFDFAFDYSKEDKTLVVDLTLPPDDFFMTENNFKFVKKTGEITSKEINSKVLNSSIKEVYYNIYLSFLNDLFDVDILGNFEEIVLNAYYEGIDKRIGQDIRVCVMTAKVSKEQFSRVNLEKVEPEQCFKFLKGKGKPNPDAIIKVDPIRFIDKGDYKLIETDNVLNHLSIDTNLAAMDWKEFEILIKDLFEEEFKDQNIEIRNTQPSNDGGIDVVAFNNNPYSGGVILLQAKRYTNTVSVLNQ